MYPILSALVTSFIITDHKRTKLVNLKLYLILKTCLSAPF